MINIPLKVNGSLLYQDEIVKIASGSSNSIQVTFTIPQTSDFNDPTLTKKAIFRYYQGSYFISDVNSNNQVIVPKIVIASPYFKVALRAENNDKTVVITTNEIQIPVDASPTLYDSTIVDGDVTIRNSDNTLHIYKVGDVTYIDFAQAYKTAADGVINGNYATTSRVALIENSVAGIQSTLINVDSRIISLESAVQNLNGSITDLATNKADKATTFTKIETEALLNTKQPIGNYATLENGKVPASQLPLGESASTVYEGNKGKANADAIAVLQGKVANLEMNKADKSEVNEVANDLRTTKTRVSAVERAVGLLEEENLNLSEVLDIIDAGLGKNYFKAGDQFHVNWKENDTTTHNIDHDVVDLEDVIVLENGEEVTKHALTLQWHFSMTDIPFDQAEFMAKVKATMPAGTYHFKVQHDSWGGNNGKTYQFTATSDIPAGSFLRPTNNYDQSMVGKNMNVYADWSDTTATTSYVISEGSDGVDLGTMSSKTEQGQASTYLEACEEKGGIYLNDYQAVVLGDNNYYYSYVRQYLNATTTGFFTQQHIFDRSPSDWSTKRGFLAGYDEEFISAIKPTKRVISSNTLVYGGVNYTMYDKIFLPTMANMNVDGWSGAQNTGGVEGNAYEYYKDLAVGQSNLNPNGTFKPYTTYAILKKYNYKNKGSAVYYWSSSALRSSASHSLVVNSSGYVYYNLATNRYAVSPAFNLVK